MHFRHAMIIGTACAVTTAGARSAHAGFDFTNITSAAGGPNIAAGFFGGLDHFPLDSYVGVDGTQHVNYFQDGYQDQLIELYYNGSHWIRNQLTVGQPCSVVSCFTESALHAYAGTDNSEHINYISGDGHVHEVYLDHPGGPWINNDLTTWSHGATAYPESTLAGYWGGDNSQHVNFVSGDGHIHEYYVPYSGANWVDNDLMNMAVRGRAAQPTTPAAMITSIASYWAPDGSQHVMYMTYAGEGVDDNSGAHVMELDDGHSGGQWVYNDLTAWSGAPDASVQSGLIAYWGLGAQYVYFVDWPGGLVPPAGPGKLHEIFAPFGADWRESGIFFPSSITNFPNLSVNASPLVAWQEPDSSRHVIWERSENPSLLGATTAVAVSPPSAFVNLEDMSPSFGESLAFSRTADGVTHIDLAQNGQVWDVAWHN
jgi:hypothetical protein